MGIPTSAVPSLKILIENNYEIVTVVTTPDKPQARGQKISYSPIKNTAIEYNLKILQPESLKDEILLLN